MRLWSVHPKYLDAVGLVALWRESLLAQKVLKGEARGHENHPQLKRFRNHPHPQRAIADYLIEIWEEARRRGYNFDKGKIGEGGATEKIRVTQGQVRYEFDWLRDKLKRRDPRRYEELLSVKEIECHPLFEVVEGEAERWEKTKLMSADNEWRSNCCGSYEEPGC